MGYYFKPGYRPGEESTSDMKDKLNQLFDKLGLSDTFEIVDDIDYEHTDESDVDHFIKWLKSEYDDLSEDDAL
jgi:L-fucose isomerase-like protein